MKNYIELNLVPLVDENNTKIVVSRKGIIGIRDGTDLGLPGTTVILSTMEKVYVTETYENLKSWLETGKISGGVKTISIPNPFEGILMSTNESLTTELTKLHNKVVIAEELIKFLLSFKETTDYSKIRPFVEEAKEQMEKEI